MACFGLLNEDKSTSDPCAGYMASLKFFSASWFAWAGTFESAGILMQLEVKSHTVRAQRLKDRKSNQDSINALW